MTVGAALSVVAAKNVLVGLFAAMGAFSLAAAAAGWPWFFSSPNVRMLTGRMGPRAARAFYAAVGLLVIALACYLFVQPVAPS